VQNQLPQMRQGHNPQHLPGKEKPYELDARAAETVHCCGQYCIAPQRSLWICTAARMSERYCSAMPRPGRAFQKAQHGAWFNVGRRRWRTVAMTVSPLAGVWAGRYPKRRVGAERIRPLDAQQTAKFDAGTVDAALDGADCTMSNLGSLLVGHADSSDQN
jgi:hypothetical protein